MTKKHIVITGASSGIGQALAIEYANNNTKLIIGALDKDGLKETETKCKTKGSEVVTCEFDLADSTSIKKFIDIIKSTNDSIDRLIHIGGISQRGRAEDTIIEVDRKIMEINYFGAITITKSLIPLLKKSKIGGKIGVTSSISGKFGFPLRSAYAASKFALFGFFESLRLEHIKDNIKVTMMSPGRINTNISLNALEANGKAHGKIDPGQANGISVEKCAKRMKKSIEKGKKDVLIGGSEILMVYFKKFLPPLFYHIAKKTNPF